MKNEKDSLDRRQILRTFGIVLSLSLAPAFVAVATAGEGATWSLGDYEYLAGKRDPTAQWTVVEIWAPWCPRCRGTFSMLSAVHCDYARQGVDVVALTGAGLNTSREAVLGSLQVAGELMDFAVAWDPSADGLPAKMRAIGATDVPTTLILDAAGEVLWSGHPRGVREALVPFLAGEPSASADRNSAGVSSALQGIAAALRSGELATATPQLQQLLAKDARASGGDLAQAATAVLTPTSTRDFTVEPDLVQAAIWVGVAALRADPADPAMLEMLARGQILDGDLAAGVATMKRSVNVCTTAECRRQQEDVLAILESNGARSHKVDPTRNNLRHPPGYAPAKKVTLGLTSEGVGRPIYFVDDTSNVTDFSTLRQRLPTGFRHLRVTLPGHRGTPALAMPKPGTSYGERTWMQRIEAALAEEIARPGEPAAVLVGIGRVSASLVLGVAEARPEQVAAVVLLSPAGPGGPLEQMTPYVDQNWSHWFREVTPQTWVEGMFPASTYSKDRRLAQRQLDASREGPLPVAIRYFLESLLHPGLASIEDTKVPILLLLPGFDRDFLATPLGAQVSADAALWEAYLVEPGADGKVEAVLIEGARRHLHLDAPDRVAAEVARFLAQHAPGLPGRPVPGKRGHQ